MVDGLSVITGISMLVFLLFYLAFQFNSKDKIQLILKVFLIMLGLFILSYIPATIQTLDRDCSISDNGTYRCFQSNGTEMSDLGVSTTKISEGLNTSYMAFIYTAFAFVFIAMSWYFGSWIIDWFKGRKLIK